MLRTCLKVTLLGSMVAFAIVWFVRPPQQGSLSDDRQALRVFAAANAPR